MCLLFRVGLYIVPMLTTLGALLKPGASRVGIVLSLTGLVLIVIAAYRWNLTAGLAATGFACWLFEARLDMEKKQRAIDAAESGDSRG